jgi:lipoprotein-anchoring transpeptidase ErfK/SrfK
MPLSRNRRVSNRVRADTVVWYHLLHIETMRHRYLIPLLLIVCVAAGGAVTAHAASDRQRTFSDAAASLRAQWDRDQAAGVPAASLAPLRTELAGRRPTTAWWSPGWIQDDGRTLIESLTDRTESAWNAALDAQRARAESVIARWAGFDTEQSAWLTADAAAEAAQWPHRLIAAPTPAAIAAMVTSWTAFLAQQQTAIVVAQQDKLAAELQSDGGPVAVLEVARHLVALAASANLDAGNVAALAAQLRREMGTNNSRTLAAGEQLLTAVTALQSLVNLNNLVSGQMLPLLHSVDQAAAEATPGAAGLAAREPVLEAQLHAARTADQLNATAQAVVALNGQVAAELAAHRCGHAVGRGKVITISLSLQEMVFYQDGCVVNATPVSTGRPQLRTPTGTFSIFYKRTPFTFVSPWPRSSPFYYFPSPVSWVMEFASEGYFIHDAPWEAASAYGPGSENNLSAASHGCVHTPTAVMRWAFGWTPIGTAVVISA